MPRIVYHGTEASAFGLLVNATFVTQAAPVTETTHGSAAHSIPLVPSAPAPPPPPGEGSPVRVPVRCPQYFLYIVYITFPLQLTILLDCLAQWLRFVLVLLFHLARLFLSVRFHI